ncbi:MAG: hypothetical protein J6023_06245 [Clostridia bacterium]|nr:hypothetical protein [Clostridia bacterium]
MDDRPAWEPWFPLNRRVTSKVSSFWTVFAVYMVVAVLLIVVLWITGHSVPVVALVIGVLSMPVFFYLAVGIIFALITHKQAVKRMEERIRMREEYKKEMAERRSGRPNSGER